MSIILISQAPLIARSSSGTFKTDALIALVLVTVGLFAMVAVVGLLGGADPSAAAVDAADGIGMLILPP
jgi:hypothetical protein